MKKLLSANFIIFFTVFSLCGCASDPQISGEQGEDTQSLEQGVDDDPLDTNYENDNSIEQEVGDDPLDQNYDNESEESYDSDGNEENTYDSVEEGNEADSNSSDQEENNDLDDSQYSASIPENSPSNDPNSISQGNPQGNYGYDQSQNLLTNGQQDESGQNYIENPADNIADGDESQSPILDTVTPQKKPLNIAPTSEPQVDRDPLAMMSPPPVPLELPDVEPTLETLTWVGFDYRKKEKKIVIRMLTTGNPTFDVFREKNQSEQPELIIRYYGVKLRRKIARDIDASEFRSPVAYIRMREDSARGDLDVVLTMRDAVRPKFFSKQSNIQLTYDIPDHYFGVYKDKGDFVADAESLHFMNIAPEVEPGSEIPESLVALNTDPGAREFENLENEGSNVEQVMERSTEENLDREGLPDSFGEGGGDRDNNPVQSTQEPLPDNSYEETSLAKGGLYVIKTWSLGHVAQDNLNEEIDDSEIEDLENDLEQEEFNDLEDAAADFGSEPDGEGQIDVESAESEEASNTSEGYGNPSQQISNEVVNTNTQQAGNSTGNSYSNQGSNYSEEGNAYADEGGGYTDDVVPVEADTVGMESEVPAEQFSGKAVSLEFHETPLSLVLKTFSEESGNNFSFTEDIGRIPITVHFRDVPWDEALKAILQTHGLSMVMVGARVVRIDKIESMTDYMKALENAREYRRKLVPTKILVIRLNHAKSDAIVTQMQELLKEDRDKDKRIQVSADPRTNSIVMEAPVEVLTKAKTIIEKMDTQTPQVEIASRIVEVSKNNSDFFGVTWANSLNFDPGRGLGFGSLNFPNSLGSNFSVDPGVSTQTDAFGQGVFRFGSINRFFDLDLLLKMEERKGTTNVLQSNRLLVLDRQEANIISGSSSFFRPAAGGTIINPGGDGNDGNVQANAGLQEVTYHLELKVTPEITATGLVNMDLHIVSETPNPDGLGVTTKNTRELNTRMARLSGETGVIGGIYNLKKEEKEFGVPFLSDLPILGALFRSTQTTENQSELLIMITPKIVKPLSDQDSSGGASYSQGSSNGFGSLGDNLSDGGALPQSNPSQGDLSQQQGQNNQYQQQGQNNQYQQQGQNNQYQQQGQNNQYQQQGQNNQYQQQVQSQQSNTDNGSDSYEQQSNEYEDEY